MLSSADLSRLWNKHAPGLLLMARGRCGSVAGGAAEDCLQEAFIRLATEDPVPDDPAAWLTTVVRNAAVDAVRSEQRRTKRESQSVCGQRQWLEPVDPSALDNPAPDEIQQALLELDELTRAIVVAHVWNGMTYRQIAEAFEMSPATAHRKYEAGIERLRTLMMNRTRT